MKTHHFTSIFNITAFRIELGNKLQLAARLEHIFTESVTPNMYDFLTIDDYLKLEESFRKCVKERILNCPKGAILFIDAGRHSKHVGLDRCFNVRKEDFVGFFEKQALRINLEETLKPSTRAITKRMKI